MVVYLERGLKLQISFLFYYLFGLFLHTLTNAPTARKTIDIGIEIAMMGMTHGSFIRK